MFTFYDFLKYPNYYKARIKANKAAEILQDFGMGLQTHALFPANAHISPLKEEDIPHVTNRLSKSAGLKNLSLKHDRCLYP